MGSINYLEASYQYRNIHQKISNKISKIALNDEIYKLVKEVNEKHKDIISSIKDGNSKVTLMEEKITEVIDKKGLIIEGMDRSELIKRVLDELFGYSILQKYVEDPTVNDIMINDYNNIWIRRGMTDTQIPEKFKDEDDLKKFILKIGAFIGKPINASSPQVDGKDEKYNLRIYVSQQPINTYAPSVIIRKSHHNIDTSKVISSDVYPEDILTTLHLMDKAGCRVIIAGPMESGKTTFMNAYLDRMENIRMAIMEDTPEVIVKNPNAIYLKTVQDKNNEIINVTLVDLVKAFKRTNATMPIVSEVRGQEAVELLDVFNAGFIRGCTSIHANSANEVIRQLVFQIKASGKLGTDRHEIEEYISRTIDIIIYMEKRKIVSISEVYFNEDKEKIEIRDLHRFYIEKETKNDIEGYYETCVNPFSPKMIDRIRRVGLKDAIPEGLRGKN